MDFYRLRMDREKLISLLDINLIFPKMRDEWDREKNPCRGACAVVSSCLSYFYGGFLGFSENGFHYWNLFEKQIVPYEQRLTFDDIKIKKEKFPEVKFCDLFNVSNERFVVGEESDYKPITIFDEENRKTMVLDWFDGTRGQFEKGFVLALDDIRSVEDLIEEDESLSTGLGEDWQTRKRIDILYGLMQIR